MKTSSDKRSGHVFVCYARADAKTVVPLVESLRLSGIDIWRDMEGIEGAAFWRKEIVDAISTCSLVLFLASTQSCASENVAKELALANEEGKAILVVLLDDVHPSPDIRYQIAGLQHISWWNDRDEGFRRIVAAIRHRSSQSSPRRHAPMSHTLTGSPNPARHVRPVMAAAVAAVLLLLAGVLRLSLRRAVLPNLNPVPSRPLVETPPAQPPQRPVPAISQGAWYVENTIEQTDHRPFLGLRIRYHVLLTQNGTALRVQGEKTGEVRNGTPMELSGRGKTPIHLAGHVSIASNRAIAVALLGDEGSTSRDQFSTRYELTMHTPECLVGRFHQTAANAQGSALWIAEKQWRTTGWKMPPPASGIPAP